MPAATLLIDDQVPFLESIQAAFEAQGVPLEVASTWEEGVERFRAGLHELVVADYDLQQSKQGLMLLLDVKRMRASTRLILISGAITPTAQEVIEARRLVNAYLPKGPKLIDDLLGEAKAAEDRARSATDWTAAGQAQVDEASIDEEALEKLDKELNQQLGR